MNKVVIIILTYILKIKEFWDGSGDSCYRQKIWPNFSNIKKEKEEASSSSSTKGKTISYKQATQEESSQEYLENPITETIMYIDDEDLSLNNSDGWSIKDRYLDNRGYPGMAGKSRLHLEMLLIGSGSVTITHNHHNGNIKESTNTQNFSMNEVKTYFQRKYPQETNDQIKVRVLDFMKDQFFCSFPEDNMSVSSKGSKEIDGDEDVLAGDSQPILTYYIK